MKLQTLLLLTLIVSACQESSSKSKPVDPLQPISPPTPTPAPVIDREAPRIVKAKQEGLKQIVIEFSEAIKIIASQTKDKAFSEAIWSSDRKTLTLPFDTTKLKTDSRAYLDINDYRDDAGNHGLTPLHMEIDHRGPRIMGTVVNDAHHVSVIFDETVRTTPQSQLNIDGQAVTTETSDRDNAVILNISSVDVSDGNSHVLSIENLEDVYGNITASVTQGFSAKEDREPPHITNIEQIRSQQNGLNVLLGFELTFSEYVLDEGLGGMERIRLNGKPFFNFFGRWTIHPDHRGITLYVPSVLIEAEFLHMQTNQLGLFLIDASGNGEWSDAPILVDAAAPAIQGDPFDETQCEMTSTQAFRCKISETDVSKALLYPTDRWPVKDYTTSVTSEEIAGKPQAFLNFQFTKDVPELRIDDILITDTIGNTNHAFIEPLIRYTPISIRPELRAVTAFSPTILELEFSHDVGSIAKVLIDGESRDFTLQSNDTFKRRHMPANALIQFKAPLTEGLHDITVEGISRMRNKHAITTSISREKLDNRLTDILQLSITQAPDLWSTTDLRFEVTRPINRADLSAFGSKDQTPFTDFTLQDEGKTPRGTYAMRLHKETTAALTPDYYTQPIVLQLKGREPTKTVYTTWSTEEPHFTIFREGQPDAFIVDNLVAVDLDSLEMEIDNDGITHTIPRAWISKAVLENANSHGIRIQLPPEVRLTPGTHRFRVKKAQTVNFKIPLTQTIEALLTVK